MNVFLPYKKTILSLANTDAGKYLLGINKKTTIIGIDHNAIHILKEKRDNKIIVEGIFYQTSKVADIFIPEIEKINIARESYPIDNTYEAFLHFSGLKYSSDKYPQIYLTTETFAEAGNVTIRTNQASYANARSGVGATAFGLAQCETSFTAGTYRVDHGFIHCDSSSLPESATITSAFIRVNGSLGANPDTLTLHVVASTAANTPTAGDWANIGSTSFGSVAFSSFASGNNDIALDSNGIATISLTAFSKFGLRTDRDINNSAPTGTNYVNITQSNCLLSVTYSLPSSGSTAFFMNLLG